MKIALVSDLHLDFAPINLINLKNKEGADVLLIAGDTIESVHIYSLHETFSYISNEYPLTALISGNHEFYNSEYNHSKQKVRAFTKNFHNIHYLDDEYIEIGEYILIGTTLWSDYLNGSERAMEIAKKRMNDFNAIGLKDSSTSNEYRNLHPSDCYTWFQESKHYIHTISEAFLHKQIIVMSHHAPSFQSVHPSFAHETDLNGAYASDLDSFIEEHSNIKLWAHGHTHTPWDYYIGSCRVVCNPRGYPSERKNTHKEYKPLVIDID